MRLRELLLYMNTDAPGSVTRLRRMTNECEFLQKRRDRPSVSPYMTASEKKRPKVAEDFLMEVFDELGSDEPDC